MMKMNRKYGIVAALVALMCVGVAYAAFTVYSNVVGVNLSYTVTITSISYSGSTISITAQVLDHASGVSGASVTFWESPDGVGSWTNIGTASPTDGNGVVIGTYNAPGNGDYYFQAQYVVP